MKSLSAKAIAEFAEGSLIGNENAVINAVVTDSRKAARGTLFIAVKGENTDGNNYIESAFENGADIVLGEREAAVPEGCALIITENSKSALIKLAACYRKQFNIPLAAVTGSVGKTTTKEFIYSVLSVLGNTLKTQGNFNNDIGLPLTLLNLDLSHKQGVVEMGMNHKGEISLLTKTAKPQIGVITNIGTAHIENLGSREGILAAKAEIMEGMDKGCMVLCGDEPLLYNLRIKDGLRSIYFGMKEHCDIRAHNIKTSGSGSTFFVSGLLNGEIYIPAAGVHNVYNALAASCVGFIMGMDLRQIKKGLANYSGGKIRQNIYKKNGITVIDDTYNANPDSMKAALDVLSLYEGRRLAVLGDMLELGDYSAKAHRLVGEYAAKICDKVYCLGENSKKMAAAAGDKAAWFNTSEALAEALMAEMKEGDRILFKGSRGMKMEKIINIVKLSEDMIL
jgi:UDP-N-acetylmuramoyl-tripeptide--D-alanyl-D-alanine ligase